MKYLIILFIGVVLSVNVYGQNGISKRETIMKLFMDANAALNKGDTLSAINKFKEVFVVNPNDTNACGRLGKIYGNTQSPFYNKKYALKYYNLFLQYSKNEQNKNKVRAEIERLDQYEDSQNESEPPVNHSVFDNSNYNESQTTNIDSNESNGTDYNEILRSNTQNNQNIDNRDKQQTITQPVLESGANDYNILWEKNKRRQNNSNMTQPIKGNVSDKDIANNLGALDYNKLIEHKDSNNNISQNILPQPIQPVDPNVNNRILNDTVITYIHPPFDILKEDVKALKEVECSKKDGTQYVSALFNHETGRDAIVLVFDDKGSISIHKDCDLMVGFREIIKKDKIDYNNQIEVSSDTSSDIWIVKIELNLPDSVLNNPLWSKNLYRMVGVYFNQSAEIAPAKINQTNMVCQNGKVLNISYKFNLEAINGVLYGKSTVCAEKTDGCKCVLAYSETNQLFGLADGEYKIKDANISNINNIDVDVQSAADAYKKYQDFCALHQKTKNDPQYYTEYVNTIGSLSNANQPEALFTSYLAHKYGLWYIRKKDPYTKRYANKCKEKIISLQRYLNKNKW